MKSKSIITTTLMSVSMVSSTLLGTINVSDVTVKINPIEQTMDVNLPEVSVLPTSPLYAFKLMWEDIRLFLSRNPNQQLELLLHLANVRLSETLALIQDDQPGLAQNTYKEYESLVAKTERMIQNFTGSEQVDETLNAKVTMQRETNKLAELLMGEYTIRWSR